MRIGIVETNCDPWAVCRLAAEGVKDWDLGCEVRVAAPPGGRLRMCHTPRYLFYIVRELLSNSALATHARARAGRGTSPIDVAICANGTQVVIRVSDRGGGMPFESEEEMMSNLYRE